MRRTFVVELDLPESVSDAEAMEALRDRLFQGQDADNQRGAVQLLQTNRGVFATGNSIVLMLPIMDEPPRCRVAMTFHTEGIHNWIEPAVSRVNALGYLAVGAEMSLPTDEDEGQV